MIAGPDKSEIAQVMLTYESNDYLLCSLDRTTLNQPMDLAFDKDEMITLFLSGSGLFNCSLFHQRKKNADASISMT